MDESILINELRTCKCCAIEKPMQEFHKEKRWGNGYSHTCRSCFNKKRREKRNNNPDQKRKDSEWAKKTYENNRDYYIKYKKEWYLKNKERMAEKTKKWRERNQDNNNYKIKRRAYQNKRRKLKMKNDPSFRISERCRIRISDLITGRNIEKTARTLELLGCSFNDFKTYLESKFQPGMTWENYGIWRKGSPMTWHIDHIIPCVKFDLTKEEEQRKCFHYTNLQPLWAIDNLKKLRHKYKRDTI